MAYQGNLLSKTLVIGIIILFVVISTHSTFAIDIKDYYSSKKDNTVTENQVIYENSYCYVAGEATLTYKYLSIRYGLGVFSKIIAFGQYPNIHGEQERAEGWIYTNGKKGEWLYEGKFRGELGYIFSVRTQASWIGIKNFYGFCNGGLFFYYDHIPACFIGFAKEVKINTKLS